MRKKTFQFNRFLFSILSGIIFVIPNYRNIQAQNYSQSNEVEFCLSKTGHPISSEPIRNFWQANGGASVFGCPRGLIQAEFINGRKVQAQWFEYGRLEIHPRNSDKVLVGNLGIERLEMLERDWKKFPKSKRQEGCRFFKSTKHNICEPFLSYWQTHGIELDGVQGIRKKESLALFGSPISEAQPEIIDGQSYMVQWFEKARLQYPSNQSSGVVMGKLGAELFPLMPSTFNPPVQDLGKEDPEEESEPSEPGGTSDPSGSGKTSPENTESTPTTEGRIANSGSTTPPYSSPPTRNPSIIINAPPNEKPKDEKLAAPLYSSPPTRNPSIIINPLPNEKPKNEKLAALKIVNKTGGLLRFTLDSDSDSSGYSWSLADGQTLQPKDIKPGTYKSIVSTVCGDETESFTLRQGKVEEFSFACKSKIIFENIDEGSSQFILSGESSFNELLRPRQKVEKNVEPGKYQLTVKTSCGDKTYSLSVVSGQTITLKPECGKAKIKVINNNDINIQVKLLSGPRIGNWFVDSGQVFEYEILSGDYQLEIVTACGSETHDFTVDIGKIEKFTPICKQPPTNVNVTNNSDTTIRVKLYGPTSISQSVSSGQTLQQAVLPGNYNIEISSECGKTTNNFTVNTGESYQTTSDCSPATVTFVNRNCPSSNFSLSGQTPVRRTLVRGESSKHRVVPGTYQITAGTRSQRLTIAGGENRQFISECTPQRTASIEITFTDDSGGSLRVTLSGSTSNSWTVRNGQTKKINIVPGNYRMTVSANCGDQTESFIIGDKELQEFSFSCTTYSH